MLTAKGPKVLESNCRLGDPETQPLMVRLLSDLGLVLAEAAEGRLPSEPLEWSGDHAVNVVLAAEGYPEAPRRGDPISGLADVREDVEVFQAGTARRDESLLTAGGRVLSVVGRADSRALARKLAYESVDQIQFSGKQYRTDIG